LAGANSTLDRWAQAIGGTAAHEAGHTYGLAHKDENPPVDPCLTDQTQVGPAPTPGEDVWNKHLMPSGCNLTGPDRAAFHRHFSYRGFGILAANIGLSIETMHNWELVNPNAESASSLAVDILSTRPSISITWPYAGVQSPWLHPTVSASLGTIVSKGVTYYKFRLTWSAGNPAWRNPSPGVVGGGARFTAGISFAGAGSNEPRPILIQDLTLLDASARPLALKPRLPLYDAGIADKTHNRFMLTFSAPTNHRRLWMVRATISQLPQLATIDALVGAGRPFVRGGRAIQAWTTSECRGGPLRHGIGCTVARLNQEPHILSTHKVGEPNVYACELGMPPYRSQAASQSAQTAAQEPDDSVQVCAGTQRDPFPSAVIYVVAIFVDPVAKHYDPIKKAYVIGPVTSKVYYQFFGIRHFPTAGVQN
jgi:hypothetical protein